MTTNFYYFREACAFNPISEPIWSSSLHMSEDKTCVAIINQPNLEVSSNTSYSASNVIQLIGNQLFCTVYKCVICKICSFNIIICTHTLQLFSAVSSIITCLIIQTVTDITGHPDKGIYRTKSKYSSNTNSSQLPFMECICCWPSRRRHNYNHLIQLQIGNFRDKYATKLIT